MKLTQSQEAEFENLSRELLNNSDVLTMKNYIAHGSISVYDHVLSVTRMAYYLSRKWHADVDDEVLIKAGILHDFYLYDWHNKSIKVPLFKMHGYTHPFTACDNAVKRFHINEKTQDAIKSHMWPLTLRTYPRSKEGWILCLADKICATKETLFQR